VTQGNALLATDGQMKVASALVASRAFTETSNGYLGTSDGATDLSQHYQLTAHYSSAPNGTVVQTGRLPVTGLPGSKHLTLALGFAATESTALDTANASLGAGFGQLSQQYATGWAQYLNSLNGAPSSLSTTKQQELYAVSAMVLAASEDKTYRGGFILSPTMPWAWGTGGIEENNPSALYHVVGGMYQIVTALIADGDLAGAGRALDYLFNFHQKPDGSFLRDSELNGTPIFGGLLQLDLVADPIILAYQLGRKDATTWSHVKRAADFLVNFVFVNPVSQQRYPAPYSPVDGSGLQNGYSPASIAGEIAGLVCAADIAQANGDAASAQLYLTTADSWQSQVENWTVTSTGPYSTQPYFLRLTTDGNPNATNTTYSINDGGPSVIDQRNVVAPGFLELVRLGVKPANDQAVLNSLPVIDAQLSTTTPNGTFWHQYNFNGYGETFTGAPWGHTPPDTFTTHGRVWPTLAGERGEYDLAAHNVPGAEAHLIAMGLTANEGYLLPEQVWDNQPPAGQPGFAPGTGTTSATPLAWTHAQFIRLAFDIAAGRLLEQPAVVAGRYLH
jgi:glucoamylase